MYTKYTFRVSKKSFKYVNTYSYISKRYTCIHIYPHTHMYTKYTYRVSKMSFKYVYMYIHIYIYVYVDM